MWTCVIMHGPSNFPTLCLPATTPHFPILCPSCRWLHWVLVLLLRATPPPTQGQAAANGLIQYSTTEVQEVVADVRNRFATGGTGDVFRVYLRGVHVAVKRIP
jgi:hypothetical protein